MPWAPKQYKSKVQSVSQVERAQRQAMYNNERWRKARKRFLRDNPLCVECRKQNLIVAATVVDHIVPHKGDERLFWDESNWGAKCAQCHNAKSAREREW